eukprot:SAG31_NODE_296_length_18227_cov_39.663173_3_plen_42_part_00
MASGANCLRTGAGGVRVGWLKSRVRLGSISSLKEVCECSPR